MAQLSSLQMELTGSRQREAELKTQLASSVAENQKGAESWASIKKSHDGMCHGSMVHKMSHKVLMVGRGVWFIK